MNQRASRKLLQSSKNSDIKGSDLFCEVFLHARKFRESSKSYGQRK